MQNFDEQLLHIIKNALQEDIGNGDHSALCCIPADKRGRAVLKIKQDGILAGVEVAKKIFHFEEPAAIITVHKNDGDAMHAGETAFEAEAAVHTILKCERLVLNCMQRMSGIATLTKQYTDKLQGFTTRLLDTRKTTPNFRLLEKEAVKIGGGINHRFGLYDMIMLKDNHIDFCGGLQQAVEKAWQYVQQYQPHLKIEVETRNIADVEMLCSFAKGKVFRIMFDNFTPQQIREALLLANNDFETEASGGINLDNIASYAATGVDYVSAGGLIHQAKSLDLSLKATF
ncbi:MAG TPA: carboxylating nicotinate-nucleotide diphosphorylase [Chitinophagaceae bacterium]|nr:carboxylating nicotinate-nucleotide diphosphorylase [Chitinophagaceae bacterium]